MNAKDVKHGIHVTVNTNSHTWEVLDRKATGVWWLHRWTTDGRWITTYAKTTYMELVDNGSRQMELLSA